MKRFYLTQHGKPCIWPIPNVCLWTTERFETSGVISITADSEFRSDALLLTEALTGSRIVTATVVGDGGGIKLTRCNESCLSPEGYALDALDDGVILKASSSHGMFNGCRTLLQLICNSYDSSVVGAHITDRPMKPFRGVKIPFPDEKNFPWFLRFIDFLGNYKINKLLLDIGDAGAFARDLNTIGGRDEKAREVAAFCAARHIDIVPCVVWPEAGGEEDTLKGIIGIFNSKTVEVKFSQREGGANGKTAAELYADEISAVHAWLAARGAGLALSSDKLHPSTGCRKLRYNAATGHNDVIPSTCEAACMIPKDILILDANHGGIAEDTASEEYFTSLGFNVILAGCSGSLKNWERRIACSNVTGAFVSVPAASPDGPGTGENRLCAIMKVSCLLWWQGYRADSTSHGYLLPDYLEKEIAQLYPMERDRLNGAAYPSAENPGYGAIEMRKYYNSPLQHSYWRVDDHYMMFLQDAMSLPNAIPFSLFQGVLDFRFENAFAMAGGSWNNGIFGIPVNLKARSIAFLHAYIIGKQQFIEGRDMVLDKTVGHYAIRYNDGTSASFDIVYGRDIYFWKNYHGTNQGAYNANPVLMGISDEGLHYTIYAREWINCRPDVEIESIDVVPSGALDGRIALFGITAVKLQEAER